MTLSAANCRCCSLASRRAVLPLALALAARPGAAAPASIESLFAPRARLWERWTAYDARATRRVDHAVWTAFLRAHLRRSPDGATRLAYRAVTLAGREALRAYIGALAALPVSALNRTEQFAYWANLYNALTVQVVLEHYPVHSIRDIDISPGLFASGPWDAPLIAVEGQALTLNDVEHRILRPIWRDPRVHYAVNCASIGCPDLRAEAFTGAALENQLHEAARAYVNHPRGVTVGAEGLTLSSIYNWFAEDFGGAESVPTHLLRYAAPPLADAIRRAPERREYRYDWALNDAGAT
jgi:Protein of unknown function, DUF547